MWIALAWSLAVVVALIVLGFCLYEITWKAGRLRSDLERLQKVVGELAVVQAELAAAQQRIPTRG